MIETESKKDTINHKQDYSLYLNDTTMEAILTRDQRTTYHRVNNHERGGCVDQAKNLSSIEDIRFEDVSNKSVKITRKVNEDTAAIKSVHGYTKFHSYQIRNYSSKRIRGYLGYRGSTLTWLRLGSLLVTLILASVNGAPTMTSEDKRLNSPRKWVNPCGFSAIDVESELDVIQLNDEQLLRQIVVEARTDLLQAEVFRDEWIKETFNTDLADLHSLWKDNHYNWLPSPTDEIPKGLNEQLPEEFLKKLEMDEALLDAYEYMQKYAVGLEQVVWDQKDHKSKFHQQFGEAQHKLRSMLCELQVAIVERGVTPRADVERSIMLPELRDMSNSDTYRNLRDWLIFRDYMNGLEYVIQVFDHLRKRLTS